MSGAGSQTKFQQTVHVEVVRASPLVGKHDYVKKPITCKYCGSKRRWLIRCEYCGHNEETIDLNSLEENSNASDY